MNCKNDQCSDDESAGVNGNNNETQTLSSSASSNGQSNSSGIEMSKAELRKTNKPIMEKRRRARINHCLNELKMLILEAMKKDPARHTKLEKADILEMTVKHLQAVQRQQLNMAIQTDPAVIQKFKTGFIECTDEVYRYIHQLEDVDVAVKQRLCNHLTSCASNLDQISSMANFNNAYYNMGICPPTDGIYDFNVNNSFFPSFSLNVPNVCPIFPNSPPEDLNNNQHGAKEDTVQMDRNQLVPSRLPTGKIALIMPSALNNQMSSVLINSGNQINPTQRLENDANVSAPSQPLSTLNTNGQRFSAFSRPPINRKSVSTTLPSSLLGNNMNTSPNVSSSAQYLQPLDEKVLGLQLLQPSSTASPPLSPISSLCSQNEEPIVAAYSKPYLRPSTPIMNVPISPSSSIENSLLHNNRHLQQQQVSSTSGSNNTSTSSSYSEHNCSVSSGFITDKQSSSKRSYSEMSGSDGSTSGSCDDESPSTKKSNTKDLNSTSQEADDQDRMWRPW